MSLRGANLPGMLGDFNGLKDETIVRYSIDGQEPKTMIIQNKPKFFDNRHKSIADALNEKRTPEGQKIYQPPSVTPRLKSALEPDVSYLRRFELVVYAERAYFENGKLVLENLNSNVVAFEIKTERRPRYAGKYITYTIPLQNLIDQWHNYFPGQKPNVIINGFVNGWSRKFLALTLDNPKPLAPNSRSLEFDYNLEKISGGFDLDENISEWNNIDQRLEKVSATMGSVDRPVMSSGRALPQNLPYHLVDLFKKDIKEHLKK